MPRRSATVSRLLCVLLLSLVGLSGCGDAAVTALGDLREVRFSADRLVVHVGDTVSVPLIDARGVPANESAVFQVSDTSVARVTSNGALVGIRSGTTALQALRGRQVAASVAVSVTAVGVTRVVFSADSLQLLYPNGAGTLTAASFDSAGRPLADRVTIFTTADSTIASVSALGGVLARGLGRTTVIAMSEGRADTAVVNVSAVPVGSVSIGTDSLVVYLPGAEARLTATTRDSAGTTLPDRPVTFRSADQSIAQVSPSGVVMAVAVGRTIVIARAEGAEDSTRVIVRTAPVAHVRVAPDSVELLAPGGERALGAVTLDVAGTVLVGRSVAWRSTAPAVATVSDGGIVRAVSLGEALVVATSEGRSDTTSVRVTPLLTGQVIVTPEAARLFMPGGTATFTASVRDSANNVLTGRPLTWRSTDPSIATVSASGVVTAQALGVARIIATADNRADTAFADVQMVPVARVVLSETLARLYIPGGSRAFTATLRDSANNILTGRVVSWRTTDATAATVSAAGVVTAVSVGTSRIIATVDTRADTADVEVQLVPIASLVVSQSSIRLSLPGGTQALTATLRDSANVILTGRSVTWRSTDASIASVSPSGVVAATGIGTARIIATADSRADTAIVEVQAVPVASVVTSPDSIQLTLPGGTRILTVAVRDSASNGLVGRAVAWRSTNTAVATVTSAGLVQAVGTGHTRVIATAEGRADSTTVVVVPAVVQPPVVTSVSVTPATLSIEMGTSGVLTVTARDSAGTVITGRAVTWSSLSPTVATVTPTTAGAASVAGLSAGSAIIRATVDGQSGTATVTVTSTAAPGMSGSVRTTSGTSVNGGTVQIFNSTGTALLTTATVNASGQWTASSLSAGTYRVVLQPPRTHSMGPSEGAFRTVTIPTAVPIDFVVQPAMWFDDFQSYADSGSLHANLGLNSGIRSRSFFPANQITLDPSGGPAGSRAMRYNFRVNGNVNQNLWTVMSYMGPTTAGPTIDTLWVRFTSRESPNFETGCAGCGNFSYKFFLIGIGRSVGYPNTAGGRFGMYLSGPANAQTMWGDMTDGNPDGLGYAVHLEPQRHQLGANSSWAGTWNTWMMRIAFITPTTATLTLYRNGQQIASTLTNRFQTSLGDRQLLDLQLGSTLNSGPTVPQQRWFRDVGIYRTRPSMLPSFPLNP